MQTSDVEAEEVLNDVVGGSASHVWDEADPGGEGGRRRWQISAEEGTAAGKGGNVGRVRKSCELLPRLRWKSVTCILSCSTLFSLFALGSDRSVLITYSTAVISESSW